MPDRMNNPLFISDPTFVQLGRVDEEYVDKMLICNCASNVDIIIGSKHLRKNRKVEIMTRSGRRLVIIYKNRKKKKKKKKK